MDKSAHCAQQHFLIAHNAPPVSCAPPVSTNLTASRAFHGGSAGSVVTPAICTSASTHPNGVTLIAQQRPGDHHAVHRPPLVFATPNTVCSRSGWPLVSGRSQVRCVPPGHLVGMSHVCLGQDEALMLFFRLLPVDCPDWPRVGAA